MKYGNHTRHVLMRTVSLMEQNLRSSFLNSHQNPQVSSRGRQTRLLVSPAQSLHYSHLASHGAALETLLNTTRAKLTFTLGNVDTKMIKQSTKWQFAVNLHSLIPAQRTQAAKTRATPDSASLRVRPDPVARETHQGSIS